MEKKKHSYCSKCGKKKARDLRDLCSPCLKKHNDKVVDNFVTNSGIFD